MRTARTCISESNAHGDVTRVAINRVTERQNAFAVQEALEATSYEQAPRRPFIWKVTQALVHSTAEHVIQKDFR